METRKQGRSRRRMEGRFSGRLSNRRSRGRHRSFRVGSEFFRFIVESVDEYAIITMDRDLIVSSWNKGARLIFGYSASEVIGRPIDFLFTGEDRAQGFPKREFDAALARGRETDERWHVRKSHRKFWCYGLSFPLRDERGGVRGFVKIVRDDSDRKRKETALKESEERMRLASRATGLGAWDYHPATGRVRISSEAARLLGLRTRRGITFDDVLRSVQSEERAGVRTRIEACFKDRGVCEIQFRVDAGEGRSRWLLLAAKRAGRGRLLGTLVDVTERKADERRAAEATAELERRVFERTARLQLLNKELETFAYTASHDLRAPLRKIKLYSQAVLAKSAALDPESRGYFRNIQISVDEMNSLIDDILELSRVSRKELVDEDVDVSGLAREIAGSLSASAPERSVSWLIAPGMRARGDSNLLAIALRNLLDNAWKFTGRRAQARIEVGSRSEDGRQVFFVKDNGAGFDMAYAGKLFKAFEMLHKPGEFPGSGVGLGIVERVIVRHRGRVWAEGRPGAGATFYFTLHTEAEGA